MSHQQRSIRGRECRAFVVAQNDLAQPIIITSIVFVEVIGNARDIQRPERRSYRYFQFIVLEGAAFAFHSPIVSTLTGAARPTALDYVAQIEMLERFPE